MVRGAYPGPHQRSYLPALPRRGSVSGRRPRAAFDHPAYFRTFPRGRSSGCFLSISGPGCSHPARLAGPARPWPGPEAGLGLACFPDRGDRTDSLLLCVGAQSRGFPPIPLNGRPSPQRKWDRPPGCFFLFFALLLMCSSFLILHVFLDF